MKPFFALMLCIVFISCDPSSNKTGNTRAPEKDTLIATKIDSSKKLTEQKINEILDSLGELDIVKAAQENIREKSMGSRNISFMPDSVAYPNGELYIAAGDNLPERFQTIFNFYINTNSLAIRMYDVVADDTVDVKTYSSRHKY